MPSKALRRGEVPDRTLAFAQYGALTNFHAFIGPFHFFRGILQALISMDRAISEIMVRGRPVLQALRQIPVTLCQAEHLNHFQQQPASPLATVWQQFTTSPHVARGDALQPFSSSLASAQQQPSSRPAAILQQLNQNRPAILQQVGAV